MPTNVIMPALGMDQDTGILVRWIKHEGDTVTQGEPIMEIETDKAVVEVGAEASGVLANVTAAEGDELPVGQVIAQIVEEGAPLTPALSPRRGERGQAATTQSSVPSTHPGQALNPQSSTLFSRPLASPKARRFAAEWGVDLSAIHGSGPEGAVLAADIAAPTSAPLAASAEDPGVGSLPAAPSIHSPTPGPQPLTPVSRAWQIMADRITTAWTTIPHFALVREVDATALREMHARISPATAKRAGAASTYTDLLVKLVAAAISRQPRINSSWRVGSIEQHQDVNVGIAVATDDGLVVPVIKRADTLNVGEIAERRHELAERATAGKLAPADITGGTFTLTNLGMYGVDAFAAIVNPPQAGILAVGRIADRVIAIDGQPAVRPTMILTLSCDHRAIDGARAAQFLDELVSLIEEPWGLLA